MISGAKIMVKCLEAEGVGTVFGYPGAAICPFYDALYDSGIRHVLVRSEQNAAHMASGWARASGRPGVCIATSGPGAANLITGIATAYMDSIPLVAVTGQVPLGQLGRDVFQETDITGACQSFTKHSYLVKSAGDLPRVFKEAFHIAATGRPGPVLIDVPQDVQEQAVQEFSYPERAEIAGYKPNLSGHPMQIKKAAQAIAQAERPILCCGGGVVLGGAREELRAFAEKTGIPVVSTMMGLGAMANDAAPGEEGPSYLGMIGKFGRSYANRAIGEADLILLCGARVGDRAIALPNQIAEQAKVIHIDVDPAEIGKNVGPAIPLVGDAKHIFEDIATEEFACEHEEWIQTLNTYRDTMQPIRKPNPAYVDPAAFITMLSREMDEDAVYVADVGQNQIWSCGYHIVKKGRFLTTGGMGTMGYSIPAAMGAKLADRSRQVVAVCGDGSFQMSMMELATMRQFDVPVKIIVLKNNYLGMVREYQHYTYKDNYSVVDLSGSPDLSKLASAFGLRFMRQETMEGAQETIKAFLEKDESVLLECLIDPMDLVK